MYGHLSLTQKIKRNNYEYRFCLKYQYFYIQCIYNKKLDIFISQTTIVVFKPLIKWPGILFYFYLLYSLFLEAWALHIQNRSETYGILKKYLHVLLTGGGNVCLMN